MFKYGAEEQLLPSHSGPDHTSISIRPTPQGQLLRRNMWTRPVPLHRLATSASGLLVRAAKGVGEMQGKLYAGRRLLVRPGLELPAQDFSVGDPVDTPVLKDTKGSRQGPTGNPEIQPP